ncbi:MAG: peptide chain release factor family protein [Planctomycetota bacterium]
MSVANASHPAAVPEPELLRQCRVSFGRASGPGGQHRNKVETAVHLLHEASGLSATASERRSQRENQRVATRRLRLRLAREVRRPIAPKRYRPSALWVGRRQGEKLPVNPNNRDYPALLAEALDVVVAMGFDVGGAAGVLGVTMSQLARLIRHDRAAFAKVNEGRRERGLSVLR